MTWQSAIVLIISTLGLVLIGYVVLTGLFRALNKPALLLPWKRTERIVQLQAQGNELLSQRISSEDRHVVQRALNTLAIPHARSMSGPWSNSDPIADAEQDIQSVWNRVKADGQ